MSAQYTVCLSEWKDLATLQTTDSIVNLEAGGLKEMLGLGAYVASMTQTSLSHAILQQSSKIAIKALKRVPEIGQKDFASIWQRPQE